MAGLIVTHVLSGPDSFLFQFFLRQKYVISLLSPHFDTVGWDIPVDSDNQFSQVLILKWLCQYRFSHCTEKAKELFDAWKASIADETENPYILPFFFN